MLSLLELKVVGIATLDLGEVSMLGISNPSLTLPSMIFGMRTLKDVSTLDFIEILQFQVLDFLCVYESSNVCSLTSLNNLFATFLRAMVSSLYLTGSNSVGLVATLKLFHSFSSHCICFNYRVTVSLAS